MRKRREVIELGRAVKGWANAEKADRGRVCDGFSSLFDLLRYDRIYVYRHTRVCVCVSILGSLTREEASKYTYASFKTS